MKKIIFAIIFGSLIIPQLAMAQGGQAPLGMTGGIQEGDTKAGGTKVEGTTDKADEEAKKIQKAKEEEEEIGPQCNFAENIDKKRCFDEKEKHTYAIVILEESIESIENVDPYKSGESEVRQCQRSIQVEKGCHKEGEGKKGTFTDTRIIEAGLCTPYGNKNASRRVICEDITAIMTPLKAGGAGILNVYIGLIYRWAVGVVGVIAVLIILINAVLIIVSQGEQGPVDEAKKRILQSLGGIAILFLSSLILYAINPDFFSLG